jgi:hypothetical protein
MNIKHCNKAALKHDLSGMIFGYYTVISYAYTDKAGQSFWNCKCKCGTEKIVNGNLLRRGTTRSCGCMPQHHKPRWKYEEHGDYIIISLKNAKTIIDKSDFDKIKDYGMELSFNPKSKKAYILCTKCQNYIRTRIPLHRFLMDCPDNMVIDHINSNGLDNRRENLRICTITENNRNCKHHKDNESGYKGVSRMKNRWRAIIKYDGKNHYLGYFDTPVEAWVVYCKAAIKHFGEFARLD